MAFLTGYTKRKKITIDNTKVDATLENFPVLVKLTNDAQIGAVSNSDGFDIRFTSSDGTTLLKYERENFAIASDLATANFWVKIPSVSSSANTEFYIYYRATDTADGADPTNVWDSNFKAVHHLKDTTTSSVSDSTSNGNDGTKLAANKPPEADGKIGKGQDFESSGSDHGIKLDNPISPVTTLCAEAWIKFESDSSVITIMADMYDTAAYGDLSWYLHRGGSDKLHTASYTGTGSLWNLTSGASIQVAGDWIHVAVRWDGSNVYLYINGAQDGTAAASGTMSSHASRELTIGRQKDAASYKEYFDGIIDEVRVSDSGRSAAYIKASYNSGNNSLLSLGDEETETVTKTGPFPTHFNPIT